MFSARLTSRREAASLPIRKAIKLGEISISNATTLGRMTDSTKYNDRSDSLFLKRVVC